MTQQGRKHFGISAELDDVVRLEAAAEFGVTNHIIAVLELEKICVSLESVGGVFQGGLVNNGGFGADGLFCLGVGHIETRLVHADDNNLLGF